MSLANSSTVKNAIALGANFAAGMGIFCFLGYKVGKKTGHQTLCTMLGLFLGLGYGFYETWKVLRNLEKEGKNGNQGSGSK